MALSIGIVGLPNVGKSTLFNALSGASVLAANYPFATKDPNVGVVPVPDERLDKLAALYRPEKKRARRAKDAKAPGKPGEEAKADLAGYDKLREALEAGRPARSVPLNEEERTRARELFLLTMKPVLYVANVDESQIGKPDPLVLRVAELAARDGARWVSICSKVEAEIQQLPPGERPEFLAHLGLLEPGLHKLVREGFELLGLQSFFTVGPDECRAWVVPKGVRASQAAGAIHSDFERGFIKAEVIRWDELLAHGSEAAAKAKGALRVEGKDYVVQDGDVMHFLFNV